MDTYFGTFPSVRLIEGVRLIEVVKIAQCLLTINIQRLLCTVIKLHVVEEPIQSSSSLPLITNFDLFVNAKTLTDFRTYFKEVIQYYYPVSDHGLRHSLSDLYSLRNDPNPEMMTNVEMILKSTRKLFPFLFASSPKWSPINFRNGMIS